MDRMLAGIKESGQVGWESGRVARVGRPPTILVPYAMACSLWKVPWEPVKPWQRASTSEMPRHAAHCAGAAKDMPRIGQGQHGEPDRSHACPC